MKLVLASGSPRRKQLLSRLGLPFEIVNADIDESRLPAEDPVDMCKRLAGMKASIVAQTRPDTLVLGADTIVILQGRLMGKPQDLAEARQMLNRLSGRLHTVHTAVSIQHQDDNFSGTIVEQTDVEFRPLRDAEIEHYLEIEPPLDKAGAYGIQDWSGIFVRGIAGCYHNVMGFPLTAIYDHLQKTGYLQRLIQTNTLSPNRAGR